MSEREKWIWLLFILSTCLLLLGVYVDNLILIPAIIVYAVLIVYYLKKPYRIVKDEEKN